MQFAGNARPIRAFAAGLAVLCAAATPAFAEQMRPQPRPATLEVPLEVPPAPIQVAAVAPLEPRADLTVAADPGDAAPAPVSFEAPTIGPETNLPLPRYVSLKTDEGNVRRGPSLSHRIDWVFLRRGMPLRVVAEYGHWRRVVDREGIGGWINYALISGHRTVIVDATDLVVRARPDLTSTEVAHFETGVIASLDECTVDFCHISAGGYDGWAPKSALWGVTPEDVFD